MSRTQTLSLEPAAFAHGELWRYNLSMSLPSVQMASKSSSAALSTTMHVPRVVPSRQSSIYFREHSISEVQSAHASRSSSGFPAILVVLPYRTKSEPHARSRSLLQSRFSSAWQNADAHARNVTARRRREWLADISLRRLRLQGGNDPSCSFNEGNGQSSPIPCSTGDGQTDGDGMSSNSGMTSCMRPDIFLLLRVLLALS